MEERLRLRAYHLWEADGRPHGRSAEYWEKARALLEQEAASPDPVAKKPAKAKATDKEGTGITKVKPKADSKKAASKPAVKKTAKPKAADADEKKPKAAGKTTAKPKSAADAAGKSEKKAVGKTATKARVRRGTEDFENSEEIAGRGRYARCGFVGTSGGAVPGGAAYVSAGCMLAVFLAFALGFAEGRATGGSWVRRWVVAAYVARVNPCTRYTYHY